MAINFEVTEVTEELLKFNPGLKKSDVGKFGINVAGSNRIIGISQTWEGANEMLEAVVNHENKHA